MKRLAWVLVAVFCAVMVQVQPVDRLLVKAKTCHCCDSGGCGMPCCPQASSYPSACSATPSTRESTLPAARKAPTARGAEKFYLFSFEPAALRSVLFASLGATRPASAPLFKVHCSYLT